MARDLSFLLPQLLFSVTMVAMLIAEMVRMPRIGLAIGLVGIAVATGLAVPMLGLETTVFGGTYRIDQLSTWGLLILLPGTALALGLARAELAGSDREGSVYALICLVTLGALMLAGAGDMMLLVLGVVLTGLGSFALVAYPRDDPATEAAMKFLVFGAVTGAIMIYGLTFWFGGVGDTLLSRLDNLDGNWLAGMAGLLAVIIGLGYKSAVVPFQFWVPDAYDGAPVSVAAYMSVITKIGAIFAFAQVFRDLPVATGWPIAMAIIGAVTMTFGYLAALVQTNVVRLLAYSSVAQSGYFLLGIVAVGNGLLPLQSLIVFGAAYVVMNIGAFAMVLVAGRTLNDFTGFGRTAPIAGGAMVVFLLSLTGIPPLFGFAGKILLFGAAIQAGFLWLAVIGILNTVLALAVYLRIIVPMYKEPEHQAPAGHGAVDHPPASPPATSPAKPVSLTIVWGVSALITVFGGIGAQFFLGRII